MNGALLIWDLAGTLVKPVVHFDGGTVSDDAGLLIYLYGGKNQMTREEKEAFELLMSIGETHSTEDALQPLLHTGLAVPNVLCYWLAGHITSQEAIAQVKDGAEEKNIPEQVLRLALAVFSPELLADVMRPIEPMVELVAFYNGRGDTTQFILSNWDSESLPFLMQKTGVDKIFKIINRSHTIISADAGYSKPLPGIYDYFLSKTKVEPACALFIDDRPENLVTAREVGIQGIHFEGDAGVVQQQIDSFLSSLQERCM